MEDKRIMSHVYDFHYDTATMVPWGRGNGWCLFSLCEVLEALPEEHALRPQLLAFFRELSAGYAALQDENGMWHQVLTDPDSYEESSCTAMFVYAFARGVRFGWYPQPEAYRKAAIRGWSALTRRAIDSHGNVHGVCRGSSYAFTADGSANWATLPRTAASKRSSSERAETSGDALGMTYASPTQGLIRFGWNAPFEANGRVISLKDYPRFDNPYCRAAFGETKLTISHEGEALEIGW